jgi:hypothetical protein
VRKADPDSSEKPKRAAKVKAESKGIRIRKRNEKLKIPTADNVMQQVIEIDDSSSDTDEKKRAAVKTEDTGSPKDWSKKTLRKATPTKSDSGSDSDSDSDSDSSSDSSSDSDDSPEPSRKSPKKKKSSKKRKRKKKKKKRRKSHDHHSAKKDDEETGENNAS